VRKPIYDAVTAEHVSLMRAGISRAKTSLKIAVEAIRQQGQLGTQQNPGDRLVSRLGATLLPEHPKSPAPSVRAGTEILAPTQPIPTKGMAKSAEETGICELARDVCDYLLSDPEKWPSTKTTALEFEGRMIELGMMRAGSGLDSIVRRTQRFLGRYVYPTISDDKIPPHVQQGRKTGGSRNGS
jgi:hypothetical protein